MNRVKEEIIAVGRDFSFNKVLFEEYREWLSRAGITTPEKAEEWQLESPKVSLGLLERLAGKDAVVRGMFSMCGHIRPCKAAAARMGAGQPPEPFETLSEAVQWVFDAGIVRAKSRLRKNKDDHFLREALARLENAEAEAMTQFDK